jgi:hypothetical protein
MQCNIETLFKQYLTYFIPLFNFLMMVTAWNTYVFYYPLANEVAKGYSNATVRPSVTAREYAFPLFVIFVEES